MNGEKRLLFDIELLFLMLTLEIFLFFNSLHGQWYPFNSQIGVLSFFSWPYSQTLALKL